MHRYGLFVECSDEMQTCLGKEAHASFSKCTHSTLPPTPPGLVRRVQTTAVAYLRGASDRRDPPIVRRRRGALRRLAQSCYPWQRSGGVGEMQRRGSIEERNGTEAPGALSDRPSQPSLLRRRQNGRAVLRSRRCCSLCPPARRSHLSRWQNSLGPFQTPEFQG